MRVHQLFFCALVVLFLSASQAQQASEEIPNNAPKPGGGIVLQSVAIAPDRTCKPPKKVDAAGNCRDIFTIG